MIPAENYYRRFLSGINRPENDLGIMFAENPRGFAEVARIAPLIGEAGCQTAIQSAVYQWEKGKFASSAVLAKAFLRVENDTDKAMVAAQAPSFLNDVVVKSAKEAGTVAFAGLSLYAIGAAGLAAILIFGRKK